VHYAWIVLAVSFVTLIAASSVRSVSGIILTPLEQEFAWSRESVTLAASINLLLFGLAGPFLGRLMDTFGTCAVVAWTASLIALGSAASAFIQAPWHLLALWGVLVGFGSAGCSMVMGSVIVNRWFVARRGLALGILGGAMSAGQMIFTPILMHLESHFGWRSVTLFVAVLMAVVVLPLVAGFLRNDPSKVGLRPYGEAGHEPVPTKPDTDPMRRALRSPAFWLLASSFGICGLTTSGLFQTHLIPHGLEHGFSAMTMAVSLGVMGATDIFGTIASGWICDRYGQRGPLATYYLLRGISLLALPYVTKREELIIFSVVYGLNWLSTVPATSALTANLFGKQNVGVVFGWLFFTHQVGAAIAALGASYMHSWFGNYTPVFLSAGSIAILASGLVLLIPTRSR
jgi:MFS family permease